MCVCVCVCVCVSMRSFVPALNIVNSVYKPFVHAMYLFELLCYVHI